MAQQHTQQAATRTEEHSSVFWASLFTMRMKAVERLDVMSVAHGVSNENRSALAIGATVLEHSAETCLNYAHQTGGLLMCWHGSTVDGVSA